MYKTVSIIGGDLRIVNLIELLAKDDFLVYTYGLENSEDLIECENVKKMCKYNRTCRKFRNNYRTTTYDE